MLQLQLPSQSNINRSEEFDEFPNRTFPVVSTTEGFSPPSWAEGENCFDKLKKCILHNFRSLIYCNFISRFSFSSLSPCLTQNDIKTFHLAIKRWCQCALLCSILFYIIFSTILLFRIFFVLRFTRRRSTATRTI